MIVSGILTITSCFAGGVGVSKLFAVDCKPLFAALADAMRELEGTAAFSEFESLIDKVFGK